MERRLGVEPGALEAFFDEDAWLQFSTGRKDRPEFWGSVCAGFGVPPDSAIAAAVWTHLFEAPTVRTALVEIVRRLRGRVRLGLLSNAGPELRQLVAPVAELFDGIVISAEVGLRKPEPAVFQLALEQLEAKPAETLFVDDLRRNIEAARRLGIRTHRFVGTQRLELLLARRGLLGDT